MSNQLQRLLAENKSQSDAFLLVQVCLLCERLERELTAARRTFEAIPDAELLALAAKHGANTGPDSELTHDKFIGFCRALISKAGQSVCESKPCFYASPANSSENLYDICRSCGHKKGNHDGEWRCPDVSVIKKCTGT